VTHKTTPTPGSGSRGALSTRRRRRAALREAAYVTGLLLSAGAVYFGFILLPSQLQTAELRADHQQMVEEIDELRDSIATLRRDTQALEDDAWVVERALRGRLGYLRPGERVFRAGG
jgi:cell division protein FtsB